MSSDRIGGRALNAALDAFIRGAEKAVRLRGEGRSTARAPAPAWVVQCSEFEFRPVSPTLPTIFEFAVEDAPLRQRATKLAQGDLFEDELGDKSGIDLYEDGLEDAMLGKMDSDLFDDGMLSSFVKLGEAFRWGVERIEVLNGRTVNLTPENLRHLRELTSRTPRPQHVRVAGKLEGLRHTKRRFLVQLTDGSTVAGLAEKMPVDELAQLFGRNVVVEGTAHFRPSGRVQRIEATRLAPALDVDLKLFALQPRSLVTESSVALREAVPHSGEHWLDHIWGKWPGDESDAEVVQLIKEFS